MDVLKRLLCCSRARRSEPREFAPARRRCTSGFVRSSYVNHDNPIAIPVLDGPAAFAKKESPGSSVSVEGPAPVWSATPIATRARFTYELDRFEKNALLILAQSEPQGRPYVDQRVELLSRSFGAFRFDVEAHVDLGPQQMEARLEEFFSRDFSRVGAVCVAVVGGAGEAGLLPARTQHCHESRVLRHLTEELPSSLVGRPRIYITEMARNVPAGYPGAYSLPITILFPDVITVHIPVIIEGESNPLQMLCVRLGSERDFRAEVMAAAHAAETTFPALAGRPIQVDSTLSLDLELVRAENEPDAHGTTESLPVGANGTTENLPNGANGTSENLPHGTNDGTSA